MHAEKVPYSSVVGQSVTLHRKEGGPVVTQITFLGMIQEEGKSHRQASEEVANFVVRAINEQSSLEKAVLDLLESIDSDNNQHGGLLTPQTIRMRDQLNIALLSRKRE